MEPKYSYLGFNFNEINNVFIYVNSFIVSLLVWKMPVRIKYPSDIFSILSYVFVVVPAFTVPLYTAKNIDFYQYYAVLCLMFITTYIACVLGDKDILYSKLKFFKRMRVSKYFLHGFLAISTLIVLGSYGINLDKVFSISDLSELYDIRDGFREVNKGGAVLASYLLPWLTRVIVPFYFAKYILEKNIMFASIAFFIQFLLFTTSGQKSIFLSLIVVFVFIKIMKMKMSGLKSLYAFLGLIGMSYASYLMFSFDSLMDILVRRSFIMTGMLTGYYIEYYNFNPLDGYSLTHALGLTIDNNIHAAFEIGYYYFGRAETSANANIYASAYSHFKLYGVVFESLLLLTYLFFLNLVSYRKKDRILCCCVAIMPLLALNDSAFIIVMVTHGGLLAFLILVFIVNGENKLDYKNEN